MTLTTEHGFARPTLRRFCSSWTLVYVEQRRLRLCSHRAMLQLTSTQGYVAEPSEMLVLTWLDARPAKLRSVTFACDGLRPWQRAGPEPKPAMTSLSGLFQSMDQGLPPSAPLLMQLANQTCRRREIARRPVLPSVARALRARLVERAAASDRLEEIARLEGTSVRTASRLFRTYLSTTPIEFRNSVRISQAITSMWTGATVAQAARQVGFVDGSHLARYFRRAYSMAPGRYARAVCQL